MRTVTAFVAHSFAPSDEVKVRPILAHLDTFRELGFIWTSGKSAEAERVSEKIRGRIFDAQMFIGVLTHKHPLFDLRNGFDAAWKLITRRLTPPLWSPPGWIVQESGFALALQRKVILFVEPHLDFPALQGDLEYVPYNYLDPSDAFGKSTQMINKFIAQQAGIRVETVVREESEGQEKVEGIAPVTEAVEVSRESDTSQPGLAQVLAKFKYALEKKDLSEARTQLESGVELIRAGRSSADELTWRCICLSSLCKEGDVPALQELKHLDIENPADPTPAEFIGETLFWFKEFPEAARFYERAANLSNRKEERATRLLACARSLLEARQANRAESILMDVIGMSEGETKIQATEKLYSILKSSDRKTEAFGTAEALLHENPGLESFRFTLGIDYHREHNEEQFLYHFNLLKQSGRDRSDIWHNFALAFSECKLPIASVEHYKKAIELGGTLAASNLGYKYLDAGMAGEARTLLMDVLKGDNVEPDVARCLATIPEKEEEEGELFTKLIEKAERQKDFLVALGNGLEQKESPKVEGMWQMPFGEIQFHVKERVLEGSAEVVRDLSRYAALYGTLSGLGSTGVQSKDIKEVRVYSVSGFITGSVCKIATSVRAKGALGAIGALTGDGDSTSGYLIFSPDGNSARYAEVIEGKPSKFSVVCRAGPRLDQQV
jgi:tetratricopeptide (TPR) repeat protein